MTDPVQMVLIGAVASVLPSIIALINNSLARRNAVHLASITKQMGELEKNTNSMKDALVKVTGEKAFAEGVKSATDDMERGR